PLFLDGSSPHPPFYSFPTRRSSDLHVVIHAGERHPARRREVPHRGGVVALVGEHFRRPDQEMLQSLVVGAHEFERLFEFPRYMRSEEHTSELQSRGHLVCRLLLEKK